MEKYSSLAVIIAILVATMFFAGCVERHLTINTEPEGAVVFLNDEEIGESPVTVSFEWYGDYNIRISKEGYETLNTHRKLKAPRHDKFPYDFFAMLSPKRKVDYYRWDFTLDEKKQVDREELIQNAKKLQEQL